MRSTRYALFAVAALAACATKEARRTDTTSPATATLAGTPAPDAAAVRQAIEAANARFGEAFLKGDTATIAATYAPDAIVLPPNEKAITGHDAIAKAVAGEIAMMKATAFALHTQDVIAAGDYAIETGSYEVTMPPAAKPVHSVGKYLTVWKKQPDGSYKLIRDMFSSDSPMK
jgi:uncharacterized protein (TIGR02246 family)